MIMEFRVVNVKDTSYYDECKSENALYCELKYKRDCCSFAAMVFEFTEDSIEATYDNKRIERVITSIGKYDNLRIGCDETYINSIVDKYSESKPSVGIKIHFLIYSDVRSCQIIFERLTELILFMVDKDL